MIVAIVAGWVELLADWWLVSKTGTLVYYPGGPFILRSPLYMPFAWGIVLIQTAYVLAVFRVIWTGNGCPSYGHAGRWNNPVL